MPSEELADREQQMGLECPDCGSYVLVDSPSLGALEPDVDEETEVVKCAEHFESRAMRRVM